MSKYYVGDHDYLMHHGIKGQHWGERRFQNLDGSLTPEGVRRYRKYVSEYGVHTANRLMNSINRGKTEQEAFRAERTKRANDVASSALVGAGTGKVVKFLTGSKVAGVAAGIAAGSGNMAYRSLYLNDYKLDDIINGSALEDYKNIRRRSQIMA